MRDSTERRRPSGNHSKRAKAGRACKARLSFSSAPFPRTQISSPDSATSMEGARRSGASVNASSRINRITHGKFMMAPARNIESGFKLGPGFGYALKQPIAFRDILHPLAAALENPQTVAQCGPVGFVSILQQARTGFEGGRQPRRLGPLLDARADSFPP